MNPNSNSEPVIVLENVDKYFGEFHAVQKLNLRVLPGTVYGFLGPNGAGKTTTLRMILDIFKPTSGRISILGHSSALKVRHRIGYLPEEKGLYKKMKAWSIIAYFGMLKGMPRNQARQRAYELLERYGLKDFSEKTTEALSKGMGQKVQILAAIVHDPDLVILDEPFSGLDPVNQEVMEGIISDLVSRKKTVLFSTHIMQHAERLCDRLLLIARGRALFDGTLPEARKLLPRRLLLETVDDASAVASMPGVISFQAAEKDDGSNQVPRWEIGLREDADSQRILEECLVRNIRLQGFHQLNPTLHEVFVRLVGSEAKKAGFR